MGYVSASHLRRDYNACNENLIWYIIKRTDFNGGISIKPYTKFELFYVANMDPFWASKFNIEGTIQEVNEKLTNDYKKHTDNHKIYAFDCMLTLEKDDAISKILSSMGILWREQDATKNSIQQLGQYYFSHKQLHKLNGKQIQEKLLLEKDINWNSYPTFFKRGTYVQRVLKETQEQNAKCRKKRNQICIF